MDSYLARVRYLASHFSALQGLRMVPLGLFLLASELRRFTDHPLLRYNRTDSMLLLAAPLVGAYLLAGRYYERRFGSVVAQRRPGRDLLVAVGLLGWLVAAGWIDARVEALFHSRPVVTGLTLATWGLMIWNRQRERRHYLWLAAGAVAVSLLPWPPRTQAGYMNLVLGVGMIAGGVLDHRMLTRLVKSLGEARRAAVS